MAKTPAWQRAEGKNPKGGLNAKGRAAYNRANPGKPGLKAPQPEGGPRRDSFCARMKGMKKKLTSAETARDPNSRINKSLRAWNCAAGGLLNTTKAKPAKVATVMREFKAGKLHSGTSGKVVKNRKQAVAIALSEGRKAARKK